MYTLSEIAQIVNGQLFADVDSEIQHLSIDTRKIQDPQSTLFFALRTDKSSGFLFIENAINQGVAAVVVDQAPSTECAYILVDNSLGALQKLAEYQRAQFQHDVIAVTGSNGKTIVKEWISYLLDEEYSICKSPKSYNSQVGVPLSVWPLSSAYSLGVFEAGISKPGEMARLQEILRPTVGVFTHLGDAHDINFSNRTEKLREKFILFKDCNHLVLSKKNKEVLDQATMLDAKLFVWGKDDDCDLKYSLKSNGELDLTYQESSYSLSLNYNDLASVENAVSSIAVCIVLGANLSALKNRIQQLPAIDMRLQQVDGINNNQLILDYYNSDFQSIVIALDFLKQQDNKTGKVVILSDILQSHLTDEELCFRLNQVLESHNIAQFIGVGNNLLKQSHQFAIPSEFYSSTQEFLQAYPLHQLNNKTILLKGARSFQFEEIAERMRQKTHQTVLEVNLTRLQHNLNTIKSKIGNSTKLMAMVKALSYGSGGFQIAKLLEFNKIDFLGVAYTDEATGLRNAGIATPLVVLNPDLTNLDPYLSQNIQPVIYSFESLHRLGNSSIKIHIEFDTGMHRLGFTSNDLDQLIEYLNQNSKLEVVSVFSHLASADDESQNMFTEKQIVDFQRLTDVLRDKTSGSFIRHISNTAGIERFPNAHFDMVRLGVGLYGVSSLRERGSLLPVSTFKSYITQIKEVPAGDGIGYGQHDKADYNRKIAVIAVGYADGFNRKFSRGVGSFEINGKRAPVVGNVCMDMTMCDVTDIDCDAGDSAIIFGDNLRVEELATQIETIPYEILTNVSERVNRVFYQE